jgi:uncharacterized SAM-binding protein YcdF (DUF218 family)
MAGIILTALIAILALVISRFFTRKKLNLYEYENIRRLGLIIFLSVNTVWQLYIFIEDLRYHYHAVSPYMLFENIQSNVVVFTMIMFPVVFLTWVLVTISNINLIRNEGRTWRNMLGLFLGGYILVSTVLLIIGLSSHSNARSIPAALSEYLMNVFMALLAYLECILYGTIIMGIEAAKHIPSFDKDYVIILGCSLRKDGTLTPLLKSRVDRALEFAGMQEEKTGKAPLFVVSGGQGSDEVISEAEAMKNYLLSCGIAEERILVENKSRSTKENMKFSVELIKEQNSTAKIAYSTTNYHVFRAGVIASEQGYAVEGIGAKTRSYFWINAFIREFIATLVSERKKHLIALAIFAVFFLIIEIYVYYMWLR